MARRKGFDFDSYKIRDKTVLRQKLNLDVRKSLLIYVGNLVSWKGLPNIIDNFNTLDKSKFDLIIISADKSKNKLYEKIERSKAIFLGYKPNRKVLEYIAASDIYIMVLTDPEKRAFAGFGGAPLEALSQGIPIISTQIPHFPGPSKYQKYLGLVPKNINSFQSEILSILNNPKKYSLTHQISKKSNPNSTFLISPNL